MVLPWEHFPASGVATAAIVGVILVGHVAEVKKTLATEKIKCKIDSITRIQIMLSVSKRQVFKILKYIEIGT